MRPPAGVNFTALVSRFEIARLRRSCRASHARWLYFDVDGDVLGTRVGARGLDALVNAVVEAQNFEGAIRTFTPREFPEVSDESRQLVDLGRSCHR